MSRAAFYIADGRVGLQQVWFGILWRTTWTTPKPSAVTLPVRLCLTETARLVVLDNTDTELTVLFAGLPSPVAGRAAVYVQVSKRVTAIRAVCWGGGEEG